MHDDNNRKLQLFKAALSLAKESQGQSEENIKYLSSKNYTEEYYFWLIGLNGSFYYFFIIISLSLDTFDSWLLFRNGLY